MPPKHMTLLWPLKRSSVLVSLSTASRGGHSGRGPKPKPRPSSAQSPGDAAGPPSKSGSPQARGLSAGMGDLWGPCTRLLPELAQTPCEHAHTKQVVCCPFHFLGFSFSKTVLSLPAKG